MSGGKLSYFDTAQILGRLGAVAEDIVLIGGQALHFWVSAYADRDATLSDGAAFTSKDVDFCGDAKAATATARALGGTVRLPTLDDSTPNTGLVTFRHEGHDYAIDFLDKPHGVPAADVMRMSPTVDAGVGAARFRVFAEENRYQFQWWALGLVDARPTADEEKNGADKGIDGRLFFYDSPEPRAGTHQIIFSVKSGGVSVKDVRDLASVIHTERAAIGVLITLEAPTKPMRAYAADQMNATFKRAPLAKPKPPTQMTMFEKPKLAKTAVGKHAAPRRTKRSG